MPELPEVETVVRGLRSDMVGRIFERATVHWGRVVEDHLPDAFAARLAGQQVIAMWRRGKFIVFELSDDHLLIHLRMTGRLYVAHPSDTHDADRWLRITLNMDDGRELRFSDMRKFGRVYLVADADDVTGKLGPEPLSAAFTLKLFRERIASRSGTIKPLLLNQAFIAGVGNIYADEALWRAKIDPRRKADTLSDEEIAALYEAVRSALRDGIRREGASFSWYRKPDGTAGTYQDHFSVYNRAEEPCPRCESPIVKIRLAQRGTHYCPDCQI